MDSYNTNNIIKKNYIIINADDFGICKYRDKKIKELYKKGKISTVSLIINGINLKKAIEIIKKYNIKTGLHLNLTEGYPIFQNEDKIFQMNSLFSDSNRFGSEDDTNYYENKFNNKINDSDDSSNDDDSDDRKNSLLNSKMMFKGKFSFRKDLMKKIIKHNDIINEIVAQIDFFYKIFNHYPSHIDGHQHIHVIPEFFELFIPIFNRYNINVMRVPYQDFKYNNPEVKCTSEFLKDVSLQSKYIKDLIKKEYNDIIISDEFIGLLVSNQSTLEQFEEEFIRTTTYFNIESNNNDDDDNEDCIDRFNVIELMIHPGYSHESCFVDSFCESTNREMEADVIESEEFIDLLDKYNIIKTDWDYIKTLISNQLHLTN
eukprot:TRINITY_DN2977_c0_g1_i1.p1 TRINITY_DN2977_c0_g1~~TRINITY_DN2977_c0_g1_i1.p1  ORF type:complete len:373 (+),score=72.49 TRINITY_DN2977_c0_g1_i1:98-1216(+)